MKQYHELLRDVMENGYDKGDRTGTGTKSVFGRQVRFDLSKGFPLLTTKKLHWKSIVIELLWFLRGDTKVKFLKDYGVTIWDSWVDDEGGIGKGYGHQWRSWERLELVPITKIPLPKQIPVGDIAGIASSEGADKLDPLYDSLYRIWNGMIHRCYSEKRRDFKWYGEREIFISNEWLWFKNFQKDVKNLRGWHLFRAFPDKYSLDKDFSGFNYYGKDTCEWASNKSQNLNTVRSSLIEVTFPDKRIEHVVDLNGFCEYHNLDYSTARKCVNESRDQHKGFSFKEVHPPDGFIHRLRIIDQIEDVIAQLKLNPNSRRIVASAWNVADIENMKLPPCHTLFQFYVAGGKLSCQLYQRSADLFLGVPFNIASYALLTHMVAKECNLEVGEFVHTFGDLHIYNNHFEQVAMQLDRVPFTLPEIELNYNVDLFTFIQEVEGLSWEEIKEYIRLENYLSHPAIKAEVSV